MKPNNDNTYQKSIDKLLTSSMQELHHKIDHSSKQEQSFFSATIIEKLKNEKFSQKQLSSTKILPTKEWGRILREIFIYHERLVLHWASIAAISVFIISISLFDVQQYLKSNQAETQNPGTLSFSPQNNSQKSPKTPDQKTGKITAPETTTAVKQPNTTTSSLIASRQIDKNAVDLSSEEEKLLLAIEVAENREEHLVALKKLAEYYKKIGNKKKLKLINNQIQSQKENIPQTNR